MSYNNHVSNAIVADILSQTDIDKSSSPSSSSSPPMLPMKLENDGTLFELPSLQPVFSNSTWSSAFQVDSPLSLSCSISGSSSKRLSAELGSDTQLSATMSVCSDIPQSATFFDPSASSRAILDDTSSPRITRTPSPCSELIDSFPPNISSASDTDQSVEFQDLLKKLADARLEWRRAQTTVEQLTEENKSLRRSNEALERNIRSLDQALKETEAKIERMRVDKAKEAKDLWKKIQEIDDENVQLNKLNEELRKKAQVACIDINLSTSTILWNKKLKKDKLARDRADQKVAQERTKAKAGKQKEQKLAAWMDSRSRNTAQGAPAKPSIGTSRFADRFVKTSTKAAKKGTEGSRFKRFNKSRAVKS